MKIINIGQTPNGGEGDNLRDAIKKINDNFIEFGIRLNMRFDNITNVYKDAHKINKYFHEINLKIERIQKLKKLNSLIKK